MFSFEQIQAFFDRDICLRASKPLKEGVVFFLEADKSPYAVTKHKGRLVVSQGKPTDPEMTFTLPLKALQRLEATTTDDIGEMGVEVLKLVLSPDPDEKISSKVHIGPIELFLRGYLSVLPLGGPTVMKYLASKGFASFGKVKDAISRMRS